MPVVFDQVVGNVVPDAAPAEAESTSPATTKVTDEEKIRYLIKRQDRRAARLRTD